MSFLGDAWDDAKHLAGDVVKVGEDIVMAPAEIAHWALTQMFGGGEADLHRIANELNELSKQMDGLAKEINGALGQLAWHGPASDAFVGYARARVGEMNAVGDDLAQLGASVDRLANAY
ncbi:WXG100 family type VII secretion target [Kitasatospora sp. NPDC001175]|uniref:WXG100 family type VII secretion target n=1 Tax=Kitasatospora sp. NPDC001175 TaxID=3157103 RepID=UPI003D066205